MKIKCKAWLKLKSTFVFGEYILILKVRFKDPNRYFPVTLRQDLTRIDVDIIQDDKSYFDDFEQNYLSKEAITLEASKMVKKYFETKYNINLTNNGWDEIFQKVKETSVNFEVEIDDELLNKGGN